MKRAEIDFELAAVGVQTPEQLWKSPICATLKDQMQALGAEIVPKFNGDFNFNGELEALGQAVSDLLTQKPSLRFVFQAEMPDGNADEVNAVLETALRQGVVEKIIEVRKGLEKICPA